RNHPDEGRCSGTRKSSGPSEFARIRYDPRLVSCGSRPHADNGSEPPEKEPPMHRISVLLMGLLLTPLFVIPSHPRAGEKPVQDKDGYASILDGKTLKGWHISAKSGHSGKSKNKSGGRWVVEEGMIVGSQDEPGDGGILITDKQDYGNFEVVLEMK